jgi:ribonuclease D
MRLLHSLGCFPKNIFDIATAARIADYAPSSLGTVLDTVLEITVNKSAQASDWHNRPLTPKQIEYAASDVLHLLELKEVLLQKITTLDRLEWLQQENAVWDQVDFSDLDNNVYLREKDKKNMSIYEWFVFSELMHLREEKAKELNRPSYKVISKDYLIEMAQRPTQIHRFDKIRNIHRKLKTPEFKSSLQQTLNKAVQEANNQRLSKTDKASKRLSPEDYQKFIERKKRKDEAKKNVFKPIQKAMLEDLGENIITLLINNRIMEDWAIGNIEQLLPYKKQLIEQYATKLQLDVNQYLD